MVSNRQPRSYWGIIFAVGFLTCLPALSQEPGEPPDEAQVEATPDDSERKPAADENPGPELDAASDLLTPVQGIESAIRDLVAEQRRAASEPPNEHEVSDLKAQKAMALWAKLMFFASIASVAVTAVGLELLRRTLKATKDAATYAESAARAAWETVEQAKAATLAAQEAVGVTREIGQAQVRAYLSIIPQEPIDVDWPISWPAVELIIENTGQSPSQNVVLKAAIFRRPYSFQGLDVSQQANDMDSFMYSNKEIDLGMISSSGQKRKTIRHSSVLTKNDYNAVLDRGDDAIFIVALVTYNDFFGKEVRHTRLCARMIDGVPGPGDKTLRYAWEPTRLHNDAT